MDKDMKPPQFTDAMDETTITLLMMRWLNDRGMAVVVFTKAELRGVDADDLEGTMIECGSEAIHALAPRCVAKWVENSNGVGQYEIVGQDWVSHDGIEWINNRTGEPVDTEEFHATTISMVGGCCDGEVVG
jgi:hypothetical protein